MSLYRLHFVDKNKSFSLALKKGDIEDSLLSSAYYLISKSAERFALENSLQLDIQSTSSASGAEKMHLTDYFFGDRQYNEKRLFQHLTWLKDRGKIPRFYIYIRVLPPPEELLGREKIIEHIKKTLVDKHISLQGPRAMGKTSILHVLSQSPSDHFNPYFISLRNISTIKGFIGAIAYAVSSTEEENARNTLREDMEKKAEADPTKTIDLLFDQNKNYLLLLDEFADFLRCLRENNQLEEFFKQVFDCMSLMNNIRFISASSESESRIVDKLKTSLERFEQIVLPPLDKKDAFLLLQELLYNLKICPRERDLLESLKLFEDYVPYFIHAYASSWQELNRRKGKAVDANEVYDNLLGITGYNLLREFQDLPRRYPGSEKKGAYALIDAIKHGKRNIDELKELYNQKTGQVQEFKDVISRLEDDLLGKQEGNFISFRLKLFKDFWQRYPVK